MGIWWVDGTKKSKVLGFIKDMSKTNAREEVARIVAEEQARRQVDRVWKFGEFVEQIYFPYHTRKWKHSTRENNVNRIRIHLTSAFEDRELASFRRDELQDLLDRKAGSLSFSVVDHLRWDLKQILDMAVAEGQVVRNPALLLFTPKEAAKPERRVMNIREVRLCFSVLDERERLIAKLAILAGMRPGEIFAPVGPVGGDPRRYSPTGLSWRDRHAENGSIIAEGGSVRRSACGHPKVAGEDGDD